MDGDIENGRTYTARRRSPVNDGIEAVTEEMNHLRSGGALLSAREIGACCRNRPAILFARSLATVWLETRIPIFPLPPVR